MSAEDAPRSRRSVGVLLTHPLAAGWAWVLFWIGVIVLLEFAAASDWVASVCVLLCVTPTFAATFIVLRATPRKHLEAHESVLSHFLVRFVSLVFAFLAWTVSIVIGASISSAIQVTVENDENEAIGTGFELVFAVTPLVLILLWTALIIRCAWFLARLRGWSETPVRDLVPDALFAERPSIRRVVIALAHPGLLLVGGFVSAAVAGILAVYEPFAVLVE